MKTVLKSEGTTSATQDQSSASIDTDVREAHKAIRQARAAERKRIVASPAEAAAGHVEDADAASKTPASSPTKASSSSCPAPSKVTAPSSPSPKKASSSSSKPIQRAAVPASHALTTKDTMIGNAYLGSGGAAPARLPADLPYSREFPPGAGIPGSSREFPTPRSRSPGIAQL